MSSVKFYLKDKKKKNMEKHFINKNLPGFVTFYFAQCLKHCKDI